MEEIPQYDESGPGDAMHDPYAEARYHYPWATEISTHEGEVKTKYNMIRGTILQPLKSVNIVF